MADAKVNDESLLAAFREGTGGAGEREDSVSELRVWILLFAPHAEAVVEDYSYDDLDKAIDKTTDHLRGGAGYGAGLVVGAQAPEWFRAISAVND